ncbi:MAG: YfhO family protein [Desulfobacteraceae bacterium]|nr:YfhO family protein [Desulfobacteraceae bacterium]
MFITIFPDDHFFEFFYSENAYYSAEKSIGGIPYAVVNRPRVVFHIPKDRRTRYQNIRFDFEKHAGERKIDAINFYFEDTLLLHWDAADIYKNFSPNRFICNYKYDSSNDHIIAESCGIDPFFSTKERNDLSELYGKIANIKTHDTDFLIYAFLISIAYFLLQEYCIFLYRIRRDSTSYLDAHRRVSSTILKRIDEENGTAWCVLIIGLTVPAIILYFDTLVFTKFYIFRDTAIDTYVQFWPYYAYISRTLLSGQLPFWSFGLGLGTNMYRGDMFDPFMLFPMLAGNDLLPYLLGYAQFFRIVTSGILFFLYLRTMGIRRYYAIIGSLLFAFSGHNILRGSWWHYSTEVVSFAFLLLGFERFLMQRKFLTLVLSVSMFLILQPFYWFHYTVILFLYGTYRYISLNGFQFSRTVSFLSRLCFWYGLGLGLGGFLLIPGALEIFKDPRFVGNPNSLFDQLTCAPLFRINDISVLITGFLRTVAIHIGFLPKWKSDTLGSPLFYCGLSTLILLPQVFNKRVSGRKGYVILLMLCTAYVLFPFFQYAVNAFMSNYYKVSSLWIIWAFIFISIHILQQTIEGDSLHRLLLLAGVIGIGSALVYIVIYRIGINNFNAFNFNGFISAIVFLVVYLILFMMLSFKSMKNIALILFLLTVFTEVIVVSALSETMTHRKKLNSQYPKERIGYYDHTLEALEYIRSIDNNFYRIDKSYNSVYLNDALFQNYNGTKSYWSGNTKSTLNFIRELGVPLGRGGRHHYIIGFWERPMLNTLIGVRYFLSLERQEEPPNGYAYLHSVNGIHIYRNKDYLPLGFLYTSYIPLKAFRKLPPEEKDIVLLKAVVLEGENFPFPLPEADLNEIGSPLEEQEYREAIRQRKKVSFAVQRQEQNDIFGKISCPEKGLLFLSIPYHKGWTVSVDGERQEMHLANCGFIGVFLDQGDHDVHLHYRPFYLREGIFLSLISMVFLCILLLRHRFRP